MEHSPGLTPSSMAAFSRFALLLGFSLALSRPAVGQAPATLVQDLNRGPGDFTAGIGWLMPVEHGVVFAMGSLSAGKELWVSDGSAAGTRLLKDILPGSAGSYPEQVVKVGNKAAFLAFDEFGASDIWLTDGTPDGTVLLVDSPPEQANQGRLTALAGTSEGLFYQVESWSSGNPPGLWFAGAAGSDPVELNPPGATGPAPGSFHGLTTNESHGYFLTEENGLWKSDGASAPTELVADLGTIIGGGWAERITIAAGRLVIHWFREWGNVELWTCTLAGRDFAKVSPEPAAVWKEVRGVAGFGKRLVFRVRGEDDRWELWASDENAAVAVKIPLKGEEGAVLQAGDGCVEWNGGIYFPVHGGEGGGLWRTDGTPEGTDLVKRSKFEVSVPGADHLVAGREHLYFQLPGDDGWELWKTGGKGTRSRRVSRLLDSDPYTEGAAVAVWNDQILFAAGRGNPANALWKTGPRDIATRRLTRPEKSTGSSFLSNSRSAPYEVIGNKLLSFVRESRDAGCELRVVRGAGGRSADIWNHAGALGYAGSVSFLQNFGRSAIFSVNGIDARQMWVTDGTRGGTMLLSDHPGGSLGKTAMSGGAHFYQVLPDGNPAKASLWRTDGTREGTALVSGPDGVPVVPVFGEMADFRGALHFVGETSDGRTALWRSDGTPYGTYVVKDWGCAQGDYSPSGLAVIGDRLSITLTGPLAQLLWTSDGTSEGTRQVQERYHENTVDDIGVSHDVGGLQIFTARGRSMDRPYQWWRSDGTDEGTFPLLPGLSDQHVLPLPPGSGYSVVAGSRMFYAGMEVSGNDLDVEPWVTDGTADGTRKLKDIRNGPERSNPGRFVAAGNHVCFVADDGEHGAELWISDGTEEGTRLLADVEPGRLSSYPDDLRVLDGKLYFHAHRSATGRELYVVELPGPP